jgi:hypothetical protein
VAQYCLSALQVCLWQLSGRALCLPGSVATVICFIIHIFWSAFFGRIRCRVYIRCNPRFGEPL